MTTSLLTHQAEQTLTASLCWCVVSTGVSYRGLDRKQPSLQTVRPFAINLEAGT